MKQQKWINISILLFIIFIIIPLILQMFGVKVIEGLQNIPEKDSTGQDIGLNSSIRIVNSNLVDICNNMFSDDDAKQKLDDVSGNMVKQVLDLVKKLSNKIENTPTPQLETIKCVADFGTKIGDDLCCGQSGILTNTKYTCPSEYPKCSNMKCGTGGSYGSCSK